MAVTVLALLLVKCSADLSFRFAVIVSRDKEEGDGGGVKGTTLTAFTWVVVVDDFIFHGFDIHCVIVWLTKISLIQQQIMKLRKIGGESVHWQE